MALKLEPGSYEIELRYETPLLKVGVFISLISTAVFAYSVLEMRKKQ